ncbi:MAG: nuclear cap binding complex subunit [Chaenotheca gracillima]|nr:MAG: nuclear cap binding complex subunit [Chaenotheca gracillima]
MTDDKEGEAVNGTELGKAVVVGVLALQGAFAEHIRLLRQAALIRSSSAPNSASSPTSSSVSNVPMTFTFIEVRNPTDLSRCSALIIPGGESTAISLVAARSSLLEPLRSFVKVQRKPVWGTCAGLILLAEAANRTKRDGQELIGGLDVRVNRNHFGRQVESFEAGLELPFLEDRVGSGVGSGKKGEAFKGVFIRAPVVEKILPVVGAGEEQEGEAARDETVVAPSRRPEDTIPDAVVRASVGAEVEIMARLPSPSKGGMPNVVSTAHTEDEAGDIIAVRQGNVFGTSFHPELTGDARLHVWWLGEVERMVRKRWGQS